MAEPQKDVPFKSVQVEALVSIPTSENPAINRHTYHLSACLYIPCYDADSPIRLS